MWWVYEKVLLFNRIKVLWLRGVRKLSRNRVIVEFVIKIEKRLDFYGEI